MTTFTAIAILSVGSGVVLAVIFWRLSRPRTEFEVSADWWATFTPETYRPMARLLDEADFRFLATLPGYSAEIGRTLRRERYQIFRSYLRNLAADFERLQIIGKMMVSRGDADATVRDRLFEQKMQFSRAMLQVRWDLLLFRLGLRTVHAGELVDTLFRSSYLVQSVPRLAVEPSA